MLVWQNLRRFEKHIEGGCGHVKQVAETWGPDVELVIAGLTNTYSSYVTTFEEYGVQRYEGASTIYGPHTLDAYIQVCPPSLPGVLCLSQSVSPSGLGWAGPQAMARYGLRAVVTIYPVHADESCTFQRAANRSRAACYKQSVQHG